jgi:hypothetical protein
LFYFIFTKPLLYYKSFFFLQYLCIYDLSFIKLLIIFKCPQILAHMAKILKLLGRAAILSIYQKKLINNHIQFWNIILYYQNIITYLFCFSLVFIYSLCIVICTFFSARVHKNRDLVGNRHSTKNYYFANS